MINMLGEQITVVVHDKYARRTNHRIEGKNDW
jgi:hypothetical protein